MYGPSRVYHRERVSFPGSVSLSHSCEDVSDGGPDLEGLVSSSSDGTFCPEGATDAGAVEGGELGDELTSMFVNSITS